ncbi:MAG: hypothetical protein IPG02_17655 [Ignavibacteria bacterium]|nr:hypothetical protein [Ignavibacteria bacterium]
MVHIIFINSSTGWIPLQWRFDLRTTNGGANWTQQSSGTGNVLYSIYFTNSQTGWATGDGGVIRNTTNGGTNWTSQSSGTGLLLHCVNFANISTGWITGFNGRILRTANAGSNWNVQNSGVNVFIRSIDFAGASNGFAAGDGGTILSTTNGGTNWTQQSSGTFSNFYSVCVLDPLNAWAVGENGTIRKTTTGGVTPKTLTLNTLLEGSYNPGTNTMVGDTVLTYLRNSSLPYAVVDSSRSTLSNSGAGTFSFMNVQNGTDYYLVIMHRNSIETWSSTGVSFVFDTLSYDFTDSSSKAFGNTVLNGDSFDDATDLGIAENNSYNFVTVVRP